MTLQSLCLDAVPFATFALGWLLGHERLREQRDLARKQTSDKVAEHLAGRTS